MKEIIFNDSYNENLFNFETDENIKEPKFV